MIRVDYAKTLLNSLLAAITALQYSGATVIQDCNDSTDFAALLDAANVVDDENHTFGSKSVEWDKDAGGDANVLSGVEATVTSLDLSSYLPTDYVQLGMYIPSLTDIVSARLRLGTDDSNYQEWTWAKTDLSAADWMQLLKTIGEGVTTGDGWDQSAVTYAAALIETSAAGDTLNDIKIDIIAVMTSAAAAVVSGAGGAGAATAVAEYRATTTNRGDGKAVYASASTLTLTALPVTPADEDFAYIREVDPVANTAKLFIAGSNDVQFEFNSGTGVLTKTGGDDFSANGVYEVGYNSQDKGYDTVNQAFRQDRINPEWSKYTPDDLADTTNIAATTYYPSTSGMSMDGYSDLSLSGKLIDGDGTLTLSVEVTNDEDAATADWVQVYGYDDKANATVNNVSVTNGTLTFALSYNACNYRLFRVKVTQSGATNTVIIKGRRKA